MKKKRIIAGIVFAMAVVAFSAAVIVFAKREPAVQYRTVEVRRGDLSVEVTATAPFRPVPRSRSARR